MITSLEHLQLSTIHQNENHIILSLIISEKSIVLQRCQPLLLASERTTLYFIVLYKRGLKTRQHNIVNMLPPFVENFYDSRPKHTRRF